MKKYVTLLTAMLCLMFVFGLNTKAATYGDLTYTVRNGSIVITDCNNEATSVKIPSTIAGKKVTVIGKSAFEGCDSLTNVTIPSSVKTIGEMAFSCTSLKSVTIPKSVTTIGKMAFEYCEKLTSVTIPNSVKTIGESAFWGCEKLKSVTIPNSVKTIGESAFWGCEKLKSVTIQNGVTTIEYGAFYGCTSLKSVTIPKSVKNITSSAFGYRTTVIEKEDLSTEAKTYQKIPGFTIKGYDDPVAPNADNEYNYKYGYGDDPSGYTPEGYAKYNGFKFISLTKRVKSVTITGSTHSVFEGKTLKLKVAVSPSNAENKKVTWSSSNTRVATVDQNGLVKIKLRSAGKSVTIKATAKDRSKKSASWTITSKNPAKVGSIQTVGKNRYVVTSKSTVRYKVPVSKKITSVRIPKSVKIYGRKYKVTAIAKKAFFNCKNLKKVTIMTPIKKIGKYAFYKCKKLKTIRIYSKKLTKKNVLTGAFKGISKKATFYVPKGKKAAYKLMLLKRGAKKTMKFETN